MVRGSDLDDLMSGAEVYRHEDEKAAADKLEGWADVFQFGTLGMVFATIFVLNSLPKHTAKIVVWYLAGFLFITATIGFILACKGHNKRMIYLNAENERVSTLMDDAIQRTKNEKSN